MEPKYYIFFAAAAIMIGAFTATFIAYFKNFAPLKKYATASITAAIIINMIFYLATRYFLWKTWLVVILFAIIIFVEYFIIFKSDFSFLLYQSSIFNFHMVLFNNISVAVFSIISNKDMYIIYSKQDYSALSVIIAMSLAVPFVWLARKVILTDTEMRQLMGSKKQLRFIAVCRFLVLIIILLVHQQGHMYSVDVLWFSSLNIMISIVCYLTFIVIIRNSITVRKLLEYEIQSDMLEDQLKRQLRHYKSYQKFTDSLRIFKHDYKNILLSVRSLAERREYDKLIELMEDTHDTLQKKFDVHKQYSNNLILDAILQNAANTCRENNISFHAVVTLPDGIKISELDICRMFANIADNTVEACMRMPKNVERFIRITSSKNDMWAIVESQNSFNGFIEMKNGKLVTIKPDKYYHGLGLTIIKDITEGLGGFIQIETDRSNNVFILRLHFPLS